MTRRHKNDDEQRDDHAARLMQKREIPSVAGVMNSGRVVSCEHMDKLLPGYLGEGDDLEKDMQTFVEEHMETCVNCNKKMLAILYGMERRCER